ncbi:MAG: MFS transporter [Candidatus Heimdallarchaeota archaeon]|nr:MFS transporter [Candidatus Heimdallarchaeota archaeon]
MTSLVKSKSQESVNNNVTTSAPQPSIRKVLKNAAFMTLFSAQFIENIGRAVSGLALEFLVFSLTKSPALMGLLAIIWLLPFVVIAPFAGVYTDRLDQRKIMLVSNILSCFASIGFLVIYLLSDILTIHTIVTVFLSSGLTVITHQYNYIHVLWPLFVLCFLNSASAAFFFPARNAYTRLIVKKENLLIANSIGSTVFQIATIVGYVLAGFLASISYLVSFIFDASTFAVSGLLIGLLFFIGKRPPEVERVKGQTLRSEMKSIKEDLIIGYRTIKDFPKITYNLIIFAAATFSFAAINVLFIVILQGEMHLNSAWYGALQALMGASGIITSIIFISIGKIKRKIVVMNFALLSGMFGMGAFAVVRDRWFMAGIMFLFGIIIVCINIPASTLIQETIPYEKQGRVFGTQQVVQGIAQLIGMGIVSLIAEFVLPMYVLLASTGILGITVVSGFIFSKRRGLMGSDYTESIQKEGIIQGKEPLVDERMPMTGIDPTLELDGVDNKSIITTYGDSDSSLE